MDKGVRDAGFGHVGDEMLRYADNIAVITELVVNLQELANR